MWLNNFMIVTKISWFYYYVISTKSLNYWLCGVVESNFVASFFFKILCFGFDFQVSIVRLSSLSSRGKLFLDREHFKIMWLTLSRPHSEYCDFIIKLYCLFVVFLTMLSFWIPNNFFHRHNVWLTLTLHLTNRLRGKPIVSYLLSLLDASFLFWNYFSKSFGTNRIMFAKTFKWKIFHFCG